MYAVVLLAVVFLATLVFYSTRKPYNFPPGPAWFPIVGNILYLRKLSKTLGGQHLALLELSKQYKTNVLGLNLRDNVVTVFSYPVIKAVLSGEEYDGRPNSFFIKLRSLGTRKGITCTDGKLWLIQRNFVVRHLRNLGFGKKNMDVKIQNELGDVMSTINKQCTDVKIGRIIAPAVINILWALITGNRIAREDVRLNRLLDLLSRRTKAFDMSGGILSHYPWLRYIAPEITGYNLIQHLNKEFERFFNEAIDNHYKTWVDGKKDDLIYSFISEMKETNGTKTTYTHEQLVMVCLDLFIAGSQTTSNTLDFAFLIMILHPDVQNKVQHVLDNVDHSAPLNYDERHKVPYIEAVLLEISRYCAVTPVIGPRRVLKDTILNGYNIPKDTTVLINLHSIFMSVEIWGDPENFRPERFLNAEGNLVSYEKVITFGLGRRRCLGESLARNCIFTFFVEILRNYTITLAEGAPRPSRISLPGLTLTPAKYSAQFTPRFT